MIIRKATEYETQKILSHSLEVTKEATVGYVDATPGKAHQIVSQFLMDGGYYLIYTNNNVIYGWIGIGKNFDYYTDEMVGFITELYVLPQYRGQGIGEKLCHAALKQLKYERYRRVQLNVFNGNRAKQLYRNLGFQEVSSIMERSL
ncbi:GNAT family N-acetyltransferase [Bacillus sp. S/N-304-OC-R1]|uniref:GNAT family N-acetyltransferase n=1 Tax=Bacillus sp. S/N-304-OC-R1 TaxID=2758034 RepID=UPI001C8F1693|nr:GNAT family N-acetyltransferase [Bacillus sp. S/N-304-OC-R1]MBY0123751.1 GNAT family N-acetyltransferase [Bacillus sp. S/N-304-OC-R1]